MRSTTHWPGGGVQSSEPSLAIFEVRSTTSLLRTASAGATAGVPMSERPGQRHEGRLLLEPGHARAGVQHELGDLVLGRGRRKREVDLHRRRAAAASRTPPGRSGPRPAANETVFCAAVLRGMLATFRNVLAVVARLEIRPGRRRAERPLEPRDRERRAADRHRLRETRTGSTPSGPPAPWEGETTLTQVAVGQQRRIDGSAARRDHRAAGRSAARRRPARDRRRRRCPCRTRAAASASGPLIIGEHVGPRRVLEGARGGGRLREQCR